MSSDVRNFEDLFYRLRQTRLLFYKTAKPKFTILEQVINLFFEQVSLVKSVAHESDKEKYSLEVIATAFRRVISSIVLLESGLSQEAHILLRNSIELMLIFIDITYNNKSLEEWKKSERDNLDEDSSSNWYFRKKDVCKRINENNGFLYPDLERKLAIDPDGKLGWSLSLEWKRISNKSLHTHSQAQVRPLFNKLGQFQIFGLKKDTHYERDFQTYSKIIFDLVTLIVGIPKYRRLIGSNIMLTDQANNFSEKYKGFLASGLSGDLAIMENRTIKKENISLSKREFVNHISRLWPNFDVSSLPDTAVISGYEVDFSDPLGPVLRCTHTAG